MNADTKPGLDSHGKPFLPGTLLSCVVKKIDRKKKVASVVTVTEGPVVQDVDGITLNELTPGMLVAAKVQAVLQDGLLLSFLTYFTGTVDWFHLAEELPTKDWKQLYSENQRVKARILYVDVALKRVGLTLKPHLVKGGPVPMAMATGTVVDNAVVYRIDPNVGMLLQTPTSKSFLRTAYMHISDASDDHVDKLEKLFKPGQKIQGRIIGSRLLDGLASISLKRSVVEQEIFSYADAQLGRIVQGTVDSVESFGLLIKLSDHMKALCPLAHLSDAPRSKISSKFLVGMRIKVRIMETDEYRRRVTVTHKKSLLGSKLPLITTIEEALPGVVTHGYITGLESYGVFVSFYGGLKGIARTADLGLAADQTPLDAFQMNQVVKCKVLGPDSNKSSRLRLSLDLERLKTGAEDEAADFESSLFPGQIVKGQLSKEPISGPSSAIEVILTIDGSDIRIKGLMEPSHLSDHPVAAEALRASFLTQPGADLGKLVVLEKREGQACPFWVSRKASLVSSAKSLPSSLDSLVVGATHPGYIASISDAGCFVRFLGRLTGLVPVPQLADTFVTDPRQHCAVGQSVLAHVLDVDLERGRSMLCLKPSICNSGGAELLESLFADTELASSLITGSEPGSPDWKTNFAIGSIISGSVYEVKGYGVLVNLPLHSDVVGFVASHQMGSMVEVSPGMDVRAKILDVSKKDGIVDLTLREELVSVGDSGDKKKKKKKTPGVALEEEVDVEVQLVKEDYLVVSLPNCGGIIGYVGTKEFNLRLVDVHTLWQPGAKLKALVKKLPCEQTGGRLLLSLKDNGSRKRKAEGDGDKTKKKGRPSVEELVGTIVKGTVSAVKSLQVEVKLSNKWRGRIYITEAALKETSAGLAGKFKIDEEVEAEVLGIAKSPDGNDTGALELSLQISGISAINRPTLETLIPGKDSSGYVQQVGGDCLWVALSPSLRGRMFVLEGSKDEDEAKKWTARFQVGQHIPKCRVMFRDLARRTLDLSLRAWTEFKSGLILPGRVAKVLPGAGGLNVQLGARSFGRVHITDVCDRWVDGVLKGFKEGQLLSCAVIQSDKDQRRIDLSLRASRGGCEGGKKAKGEEMVPELESANNLSVGQLVSGYVKNTSGKGCFVALSRTVDALVRLCDLSDKFIQNPAAEFGPGKLVKGRIVRVDNHSGRVEMTLKLNAVVGGNGGAEKREQERSQALEKIDVGHVVWGKVRKIEAFGVFIDVEGPGKVTGMCHVSELADQFVRKAETLFNVGDRLRAKVIRVNHETGKLYLGLKTSYFDAEDPQEPQEEDVKKMEEEEVEAEASEEDLEIEESEESDEEEERPTVKKQKHGSAPVLEVEGEMDWGEIAADSREEPTTAPGEVDDATGSKRKRDKKREKEAREQAIQTEERKRLSGDSAPQSQTDFERLVLTAQSSSYVWIKYIAWHVSQSEVEVARKVAERALETIHYREEGERFNVWMAYLNLENMYGEPTPAEAVAKLFQKAVNAADGKKLHLSCVAMYERSEKPELAEQLLKAACRKYSMSAKVWLRHIEHLLTRGKGDNAKALMDRSLQSLARRKHIKVISRTALLEFKIGDAERGRSIFEGVLNNFPNRVDLWSIYLDQEVKLGDVERTRGLFERVTCLALPARKMKTLFKRYLEFEKDHGDEKHNEHVKSKALEFVEHNL